jgi:DNA-binding transcriptional LysR family regulator
MDINLARTFLEIVTARSFLRATERRHVTQTAVSARARMVKELLGRELAV